MSDLWLHGICYMGDRGHSKSGVMKPLGGNRPSHHSGLVRGAHTRGICRMQVQIVSPYTYMYLSQRVPAPFPAGKEI